MTLRHHRITAGLASDIEQGRKVDLDTSVVAVDNYGNVLMDETVYYGNLANTNASIQHSGDDTTGELKGDDESLLINLDRGPSEVMALYFLLTVATPGITFEDVKSARVRLLSTDERKHWDMSLCSFQHGTKFGSFLGALVSLPRFFEYRLEVNSD